VQRPSISAWNDLAAEDYSHKAPVICQPVLMQKIIQPSPERSTAFFLSYDPSVVQMSNPFVIPSAIHDTSSLECAPEPISSHIQVPPHVARNSQKDCVLSLGVGVSGLSWSLFTLHSDIPTTEVGIPVGKFWADVSSCVFWYIDVERVRHHPNLHLKYLIVVPFMWYSLFLSLL
jgi:hypothetical protein